jgi:hypothetical protein
VLAFSRRALSPFPNALRFVLILFSLFTRRGQC